MSPAVRLSTFGPGVVRFDCDALLTSKSKLTLPASLFLAHARYRKLSVPTVSPATAKRARSALLFGIEPATTVTFVSLCDVPCPNALSVPELTASFAG